MLSIMPLGGRHSEENILAPAPIPAPRQAVGLAEAAFA